VYVTTAINTNYSLSVFYNYAKAGLRHKTYILVGALSITWCVNGVNTDVHNLLSVPAGVKHSLIMFITINTTDTRMNV